MLGLLRRFIFVIVRPLIQPELNELEESQRLQNEEFRKMHESLLKEMKDVEDSNQEVLAMHEEKMNEVNHHNKELMHDNKELIERVEVQKKELKQLKEELKIASQRFNETVHQAQACEKSLAMANKNCSDLQDHIQSLVQERDKSVADAARMVKELASLEEKILNLSSNMESLRKQLEYEQYKNKELEAENTSLKSSLSQQNTEVTQLKSMLRDERLTNAVIGTFRLWKLRAIELKFSEQLKNNFQINKMTKDKYNVCAEEIKNLKSHAFKLQDEIQQTRIINNELIQNMKSLEQEMCDIKIHNESLQQSNKEQGLKILDLEKELDFKNVEFTMLQRKFDLLNDDLKQMEHSMNHGDYETSSVETEPTPRDAYHDVETFDPDSTIRQQTMNEEERINRLYRPNLSKV